MVTCLHVNILGNLGSKWGRGGRDVIYLTYMYLYYYTYIIHKFIYQMIPLRLPPYFSLTH